MKPCLKLLGSNMCRTRRRSREHNLERRQDGMEVTRSKRMERKEDIKELDLFHNTPYHPLDMAVRRVTCLSEVKAIVPEVWKLDLVIEMPHIDFIFGEYRLTIKPNTLIVQFLQLKQLLDRSCNQTIFDRPKTNVFISLAVGWKDRLRCPNKKWEWSATIESRVYSVDFFYDGGRLLNSKSSFLQARETDADRGPIHVQFFFFFL